VEQFGWPPGPQVHTQGHRFTFSQDQEGPRVALTQGLPCLLGCCFVALFEEAQEVIKDHPTLTRVHIAPQLFTAILGEPLGDPLGPVGCGLFGFGLGIPKGLVMGQLTGTLLGGPPMGQGLSQGLRVSSKALVIGQH
jgi:hypothetical protein